MRCGAGLVLVDRDEPDTEIWHDEWECPLCRDGVYLDWPSEKIAELKRIAETATEESMIPIEEILKRLDIED